MKKRSKAKNKNLIYSDADILPEVSLAAERCCNDEETEADRISNLPDDILVSILSLLRFREATATKILSSRWRSLSIAAYIVALDFPSDLEEQVSDFGGNIQTAQENEISYYINWVNHVLDSYEGSQSIDKFKIDIPCVEGADLKKWLEFALSRETEIIDIRIIYSKNNIYNSYHYFYYFMEKTWHSLPGLKYLKELSLSGACFSPCLENFVFLERLSIESPQTVSRQVPLCGTHFGSNCKLKHLSISNVARGFSVTVCHMTELVSLRCHGLELYELYVDNVPKLVDFSIVNAIWDKGYGQTLPSIESDVYAQLLRVRLYIRLRDHGTGDLSYMPPTFTKVKHMELDIEIDEECSNHLLFRLIQTCPSMEELEIKFLWASEVTYKYKRLDKDLIERKASIDKLKTVRLSGYLGSVSELEFVLYVANNATNLEDLIILSSTPHKRYVIQPKYITRAFEHLRSRIPSSVNLVSL